MLTLSWEPLPAVVGIVMLSLAAVWQMVSRKVPNLLTLPAMLAGWGFAIYLDASGQSAWPGQAFLASLLGTFLALAIMLPLYSTDMLGAGCVKAQMAFGAWLCSAVPLMPALALVACTTIGGLAVTFAFAYLRAAEIPEERRNNCEFPAQVTMSVVAVIVAVTCWAVSYSA